MDNQRYRSKAKASFKTKLDLFLFKTSLNKAYPVDFSNFPTFVIDDSLIKEYTTIYWQESVEHEIRDGKTINDIYFEIKVWKEEYKKEISSIRKDYVDNQFKSIYPPEKFDELLKENHCHYCGITIERVKELALKRKLFKKSSRGWSLEIDRIDSNKEYRHENCVMACYWCNNAKTDEFNKEEFKRIGETIGEIWNERLDK